MSRKTLVIMAAGMGSRFGGNKQITPVDDAGNIIMDFSIYDAVRAGFDKVVCVIKHSFEDEFKRSLGEHIARHVELEYAYQELDNLPAGFQAPEGRVKPWGTAHAVLCAADCVDSPFSVINADDFYGPGAFRVAADFLDSGAGENVYAAVGYRIQNTLSENGSVSRGVCSAGKDGCMTDIIERTNIIPTDGGAKFSEDNGATWQFLPNDTIVSMNLWCFQPSMLEQTRDRFVTFLKENLPTNPMKCEYYLPSVPDACIREGVAKVRLLSTDEKWFGMTYREDLPLVRNSIARMKEQGIYPERLWR